MTKPRTSPIAPSREGKTMVSIPLTPKTHKQLKILAAEQACSMQELLIQGLQRVFIDDLTASMYRDECAEHITQAFHAYLRSKGMVEQCAGDPGNMADEIAQFAMAAKRQLMESQL